MSWYINVKAAQKVKAEQEAAAKKAPAQQQTSSAQTQNVNTNIKPVAQNKPTVSYKRTPTGIDYTDKTLTVETSQGPAVKETLTKEQQSNIQQELAKVNAAPSTNEEALAKGASSYIPEADKQKYRNELESSLNAPSKIVTLKVTPKQTNVTGSQPLNNDLFSGSRTTLGFNIGGAPAKPILDTKEKKEVALSVLTLAVGLPILGPVAVAKEAAIGVGASQAIKTGAIMYSEGISWKSLVKSGLTGKEIVEAGAFGVATAALAPTVIGGAVKLRNYGLTKIEPLAESALARSNRIIGSSRVGSDVLAVTKFGVNRVGVRLDSAEARIVQGVTNRVVNPVKYNPAINRIVEGGITLKDATGAVSLKDKAITLGQRAGDVVMPQGNVEADIFMRGVIKPNLSNYSKVGKTFSVKREADYWNLYAEHATPSLGVKIQRGATTTKLRSKDVLYGKTTFGEFWNTIEGTSAKTAMYRKVVTVPNVKYAPTKFAKSVGAKTVKVAEGVKVTAKSYPMKVKNVVRGKGGFKEFWQNIELSTETSLYRKGVVTPNIKYASTKFAKSIRAKAGVTSVKAEMIIRGKGEFKDFWKMVETKPKAKLTVSLTPKRVSKVKDRGFYSEVTTRKVPRLAVNGKDVSLPKIALKNPLRGKAKGAVSFIKTKPKQVTSTENLSNFDAMMKASKILKKSGIKSKTALQVEPYTGDVSKSITNIADNIGVTSKSKAIVVQTEKAAAKSNMASGKPKAARLPYPGTALRMREEEETTYLSYPKNAFQLDKAQLTSVFTGPVGVNIQAPKIPQKPKIKIDTAIGTFPITKPVHTPINIPNITQKPIVKEMPSFKLPEATVQLPKVFNPTAIKPRVTQRPFIPSFGVGGGDLGGGGNATLRGKWRKVNNPVKTADAMLGSFGIKTSKGTKNALRKIERFDKRVADVGFKKAVSRKKRGRGRR